MIIASIYVFKIEVNDILKQKPMKMVALGLCYFFIVKFKKKR